MDNIGAILKQVLPTLVEREVRRVLAEMPIPQDGKDGKDGIDGAPGPCGDCGSPGIDGVAGKDGSNGSDGRGIDRLEIRGVDLYVLYTDGTDQSVGRVVGDAGVAGKDADTLVVSALINEALSDVRKQIETLRVEVKAVSDGDAELAAMIKGFLADA